MGKETWWHKDCIAIANVKCTAQPTCNDPTCTRNGEEAQLTSTLLLNFHAINSALHAPISLKNENLSELLSKVRANAKKKNMFPVNWCCILAKMCLSTRDTGDAILCPDLETGMTLRPNALPANVLRWDAQSPRVARTAPLTSRCQTRGQNMELHERYSTSASATHGTVAPKKRKTWSFITSSSEPQNLKKTHESRLLGYFRETLQINIS